MQFLQFPFDPNEVSPFFFAVQFKHKGLLYRVAISDTIIVDGECTGSYSVLSVSMDETANFEIYKDEEENWTADNSTVPQELVYVIGCEIDKELEKHRQWFEKRNGRS